MAERTGRAVVDLRALVANYAAARTLACGRDVIGVVKADAYGHGAAAVGGALVRAGCTQLAVVDVQEASALRDAGLAVEVLVLGGVHDAEQAALAAAADLTPTVHDRGALARLREAAQREGRPLSVSLEVDTGMRRMGASVEEAQRLAIEITADPQLGLAGLYTHLASADDRDPASAREQLGAFRALLARLREQGIRPPAVHAANSAALLAGAALRDALPEATAVRPGLMLYGARTAEHQAPDVRLAPVMSVHTRVVALRDVAAGQAVGYDHAWRAPRATRIATLPIGYADGVLRTLTNRGAVWLAGAVRPIVGRVSMDYLTVDVGGAAVAIGDEATFFGLPSEATSGRPSGPSAAQPHDRDAEPASGPKPPSGFGAGPGVRVEEQARAAGTLAYELLVRVGERLPRRHTMAVATTPEVV